MHEPSNAMMCPNCGGAATFGAHVNVGRDTANVIVCPNCGDAATIGAHDASHVIRGEPD